MRRVQLSPRGRNEILVNTLGKGCALGVLFLSLSDQMSKVVGSIYFNSLSFLVCLVAVLALGGLLFIFRSPKANLGFACVSALLCLAWGVITFLTQSTAEYGDYGLVFASIGRFSTFLVNMQWNYRISLEAPDRAPSCAAASVLVGLCLFFSCASLPGFFAQLLTGAMVSTCCLANVAVSFAEYAGSPMVTHAADVSSQDAKFPVSSDSRPQTRLLYFGSRALYGLILGILVSLAALGSAETIRPAAGAAAALLAVCLGVFLHRLSPDSNGMAAFTCLLPMTISCIAYLGFGATENVAALPCLFALLAEAFWTTQNLYQLASYRRMCGIDASWFAHADYIAQIIPFYLAVWFLSSSGRLNTYLVANDVAAWQVSLILIIVLGVACLVAMVWHTTRYIPHDKHGYGFGEHNHMAYDHEAAPSDSGGDNPLDCLSQRELDVFSLMAQGYSRSYIAKVLFVAPETVKTHARHIYSKLGISSKDELIAIARKFHAERP